MTKRFKSDSAPGVSLEGESCFTESINWSELPQFNNSADGGFLKELTLTTPLPKTVSKDRDGMREINLVGKNGPSIISVRFQDTSPIEWRSQELSKTHVMDISKMFALMEFRILDGDGKALAADVNFAPLNLFPYAIISDLQVWRLP